MQSMYCGFRKDHSIRGHLNQHSWYSFWHRWRHRYQISLDSIRIFSSFNYHSDKLLSLKKVSTTEYDFRAGLDTSGNYRDCWEGIDVSSNAWKHWHFHYTSSYHCFILNHLYQLESSGCLLYNLLALLHVSNDPPL